MSMKYTTGGGVFTITNPQWPIVQQGWQCPLCHIVWAPTTPCCTCSGKTQFVVSSTGTGNETGHWPPRDDLPTEDPDAND